MRFTSILRFFASIYSVGGVIHNADGVTVTSPVLMWVKALDLIFEKLQTGNARISLLSPHSHATDNFDFASVAAVSASGQQHGSVYWKKQAATALRKLDASADLSSQLSHSFSVLQSPIWMDSSTSAICSEIEVGDPTGMHDLLPGISIVE